MIGVQVCDGCVDDESDWARAGLTGLRRKQMVPKIERPTTFVGSASETGSICRVGITETPEFAPGHIGSLAI
jgi:hypothetical protein